MRLNYFDYFRAIAIIFIVAGHSYSTWAIDTKFEMILANIITGGTALFVFISGFFFHHVFYKQFNYKIFLVKKFKAVLSPYLLLSTLAFIIIVIYLNRPNMLLVAQSEELLGTLLLYLQYLWLGMVLPAYWYIPFIMVIFVLSPLFIGYINLETKKQILILVALLGISMVVHRPNGILSPIHSVIYYAPIYLFIWNHIFHKSAASYGLDQE